jgi:hypothetical protein
VAKAVKAVAAAEVKEAKEVKVTKEVVVTKTRVVVTKTKAVATKTRVATRANNSNRRRERRCRFQSPRGLRTIRFCQSCSQKPEKQGWRL